MQDLESLSKSGLIELFYCDECSVSMLPCVPYGWQFSDEEVAMPSAKGEGLNCFALLTRENDCRFATTKEKIDSSFIFEQFEHLSMGLKKLTVVVLDNARVHTSKLIKERLKAWQARGLFLFYLPTYSPHLNIAETLWRKLKYEWLSAEDYESSQTLSYSVRQALASVGKQLKIRFSDFSITQN